MKQQFLDLKGLTELISYLKDMADEKVILPYASSTLFPSVGDINSIYIDTATNSIYRWDSTNKKYEMLAKAVKSVSISESAENGKITLTVDGVKTTIPVHGLGSAAYTDIGDYATADHSHTKDELGLGNVDNTADSEKNVKYAVSSGTATTAINVSGSDDGIDADRHVWFSDSDTETKRAYSDNLKYNPTTNTMTTNISGTAANANIVPWSGITGKPTTYPPASHSHDDSTITSLDASKLFGTIDIARLPHGALERCVIVGDDTERFKLTTTDIQLGDTVKVNKTQIMYFVIDESKLDSEAGYTVYAAGSAASVPWSGVTEKPDTFTPSEHVHPYINELSVSGTTITYTKGDGTTGTIVTQDTNTWRGIQDNLTSESSVESLSAAQGKRLNDIKMGIVKANNYYGIAMPDGTTTDWVRTTIAGFLPYESGSVGNGHSSLGSESWYFSKAYIDNIYGNLQGNAKTANKLTTAKKIGNASFDGTADISLSQMGLNVPVEITKADYLAKKKAGTLNANTYYNVIDEFDSADVINDSTVTANSAFSSTKSEKTYAKKSTIVTTTLTASKWTGSSAPYSYVLSVSGVTSSNIVEIDYASNASSAAIEAYQNAMLADGGQTTNQITIKATEKPTVDIPITVVIRNDL